MNLKLGVRAGLPALMLVLTLIASSPATGADATGVVPGEGGIEGGVKLAPLVAPSDRTPFALAYRIAGLGGGERYALKVRLSSTSGSFGYTWNPALSKWIYTSSSWSTQPTMTAGAEGEAAGWLMARVSRSEPATQPAAGLSLMLRREGTDTNITTPVETTLTLLPVAAGGLGLLHSPPAAALAPATSTAVVVRDSASRVVGLTLSEPNRVDDDDNGVVDDEAFGLQPSFRVSAPSLRLLSVDWPGHGTWSNQVSFGGFDLEVPRPGVPPALVLTPRPRVAVYGGRASLVAAFAPAREETVTIEASSDGRCWRTLSAGRTNENGRSSLSLVARMTLRYRAVWLGTPSLPAAISRVLVLPVVPRIASHVSPRHARPGSFVCVRGSFRPYSRGRRLKLLIAGPRLSLVRVVSLSSTAFVFRVPLKRRGLYRLRLLYEGDRGLSRRLLGLGCVRVR